jgi:regulatory protein YycI of two-component signal transduction system YycFG
MKKWMNTTAIFLCLIIILLFLAYKYFNAMPIEAENTLMNNDDNLYLSIDNYEEIHIKSGVPQQTNDYDCGVFQLTIIDSLLNNNYEFSQNNMPNIRKNLLAFAVLGNMYK